MRSRTPLHNPTSRSRLEVDRASASCFSLTKVDSETGVALSGARFMLTEMSVGAKQTNVSNEAGIVSFAVQACHAYVLREITPPPGYVIDATLYIISIDRCGQAMVNNRRQVPFLVGNQRVASLFSIVYSANGGTGGYVETGLVEGSTYIVKTPGQVGISFPSLLRRGARASAVFTGWNTAPDGSGLTYQPGDAVVITRDLTFYAQWQITVPNYSITYAPNGGSGGLTDSNIPEGTGYTIRTGAEANVSYPGNQLTGWNTMPDGSGMLYLPGSTITVTSNLTLYAQWQPASLFSVTYDANGGIGLYVSGDIPGGSLYTILSPAETGISRPGYVFTAWNTSATGTGAPFMPGDEITVAENRTLYAQWIVPTLVTITYDANGGEGGEVYSQQAVGTPYTIATPEEQGFDDPGSTFTDWNTEPDGSGTSFLPGDEIIVQEDIQFFAQWEPAGTFSAIYDPNGGEGGHTDGGLLPGAFYTILAPVEAGISHPAFSFVGWNTESDGAGTPYLPGDVTVIEGDLPLYAQWEAVASFTVSYDANGGEGGSAVSGLLDGASYTVSTPEQAGVSHPDLSFVAWNTDPLGMGNAYAPDDVITIEGDMSLYAQWEAAGVFFVIYDANDGEGGYIDEGLEPGSFYVVLAPEDIGISRAGYDFAGWNVAPDGSDEGFTPGDTFLVVSDMLLYAQWV